MDAGAEDRAMRRRNPSAALVAERQQAASKDAA
jgi:hypothetical protein